MVSHGHPLEVQIEDAVQLMGVVAVNGFGTRSQGDQACTGLARARGG